MAENPKALALAKLEESGLDDKDLKRLKLEPLTAQQVGRLAPTFRARPGLRIPYHTPAGKPTGFYRLRYLGPPPSIFGEQPTKIIKYVQPPDTGTAAYFAPGFDWKAALAPRQPLFLTEGEFKSAKGCKDGIPVIGLGGVFNFQSAAADVPFLPELEAIDWRGRAVNIVFDSDYETNPDIRLALHRLVRALTGRGAVPRVVSLPNLPDREKTGLDDFLVSQGRAEFEELVAQATEGRVAAILWQWNERFAFIKNPGLVLDLQSSQRMKTNAFEDEHYRNVRIEVQVPRADGSVGFKELAVPTLWLDWRHRFELERITYAPGRPRVYDNAYNLWQGWGAGSVKGDVTPWKKLLDHVFAGAEPAARQWFEKWAAYPVQHPGTKLFSAVVFWTLNHGVGKSLIGEALSAIYGEQNSSEIGQEELQASFNDWAHGKQFVFGDEVTGSDNHAFADRLKKLITQHSSRINQKYVPTFTIPDCVNYLFTTNKPNAFFVEKHDRRYFIQRGNEERYDFKAGRECAAWFRSPEGGAALRYYLEHLDLKGFEPQAPAFFTESKAQAIEDSQTDAGIWLSDLKRNPDSVPLLLDLATSQQLLAEYERLTGRTRLTVNGMARELTRAGFQKFNKDKFIYPHGQGNRYWIAKNEAKWLKASGAQGREYLEEAVMVVNPEGKF